MPPLLLQHFCDIQHRHGKSGDLHHAVSIISKDYVPPQKKKLVAQRDLKRKPSEEDPAAELNSSRFWHFDPPTGHQVEAGFRNILSSLVPKALI